MEVVLAVIAAVSGGGLVKLLDWFINKNKNDNDEDRQWRAEYRQRVEDLELDVKEMRVDLAESHRREAEWKLHCEQMFFDFKQFQLEMYQVLLQNGIDPTEYIKPYEFPTVKYN